MLLELTIRNFAIIDQLALRFDSGFTVLTGETGAGKSIIIDGLNLLLGGRADSTMVRTGTERAEIEGLFRAPPEVLQLLTEQQLQGDDPELLTLAREVRANGRSVSRVNGRIVNLSLLRQVTAGLVDIHGQSEHLSLMRVREHLNLLDRYAGLEDDRAALLGLVRQLDKVRSQLDQLQQDEREIARRVDLLSYQISEIRSAELEPGEGQALQEERTRLTNAEQLAELAKEAYSCLSGRDEVTLAVQDLLGAALRALARLAKIDASQAELLRTVEGLSYQIEEVTDALRAYREQIEFNPARLAAVEERVEIIRRLKRKYGDSIAEVLRYADKAAEELDEISHSEERIQELEVEEQRLLEAIGKAGLALSLQRRAAAERLSVAVEAELTDLRMSGARFGVDIKWRLDPTGAALPPLTGSVPSPIEVGAAEGILTEGRVAFDSTGLDHIEFLISTNPGEPLKPMVKIASGGETARLMLAIKTVLSRADRTPTLVFDEIDQGIGGRVGHTVGIKLWSLTDGGAPRRQAICITHLPQLAGFGDAHYRVEKLVRKGRTITRAYHLEAGSGRISELAQMLGEETQVNRQSAQEILDQVRQHKERIHQPDSRPVATSV